ncbi:nickel-dependent lactate racemase [candidate division KSB1 bacterium]|nr:MAG: nickel-dependent lactate racemase [candidate division KSB1 bacterium]
MKVRLAYGKSGLEVEIPDRNLVKVLTMQQTPRLSAPQTELQRLLQFPIATLPLRELAQKRRSACVVVSDITRPVPNCLLLPVILEELEASGILRNRITILIATGLHRPNESEELIGMLGKEIVRNYRIVNHHAREDQEQTYLGEVSQGIPVYLDSIYLESDLKITTGFIEPHLMAGFSGGRKLIAPGICGQETIKELHSPKILEDPRCREGNLEGNPLHEIMLEIAELAGHDFIVNVSLDEKRQITGVFAGDPVEAHLQGVEFVRQHVRDTVPKPVDIVVTTSAGYPLDLTFYQAIKGLTAAIPIAKPGGTIILAAACEEGLGGPEFTQLVHKTTDLDEFMERILHKPVEIDQWQMEECAKVARKADIFLVTQGLSKADERGTFTRIFPDFDQALQAALTKHGSSATIAVIPQGPYVLAEVESD